MENPENPEPAAETAGPIVPSWAHELARLHVGGNRSVLAISGCLEEPVGSAPNANAFLQQVFFQPRTLVGTWQPNTPFVPRDAAAVSAWERLASGSPAPNATDPIPKQLAALEQRLRLARQQGESVGVTINLERAQMHDPAWAAFLAAWAQDAAFRTGDWAVVLLGPELPTRLTELPGVGHVQLPPDVASLKQQLEARFTEKNWPKESLESIWPAVEGRCPHVVLERLRGLTQPPTPADLTKESALSASPIPEWQLTVERLLATQTVSQLILHGNIVDYVRHELPEQAPAYPRLPVYLREGLFADRDLVLTYDRANGIGFSDAQQEEAFFVTYFFEQVFQREKPAYENWLKSLKSTAVALSVLERYITVQLEAGHRVGLVLEFAETLVPANAGPADRAVLILLQKWARESQFHHGGLAVVLTTETLAELHPAIVRNPFTYSVEVPYPSEADRLAFLHAEQPRYQALAAGWPLPPQRLARDTAGLTLVQVRTLLAEVVSAPEQVTEAELIQRKKDILEAEANGLLAFVETPYSLDAVAGHAHAKTLLRNAVKALQAGREDVLPMGYLVAGPVGTGKTFLVSSFASEIGIPMVELKNFRGQYVGQTEANLERILRLLTALNPVAVMIDEADAALGNRSQGGDSGVSGRVFSMIARFMADTKHRGKIIWFLLSSRPDLMPVDLKRQGRAEEHLALFYPETLPERRELFEVMLRKTGVKSLTGSDFEDAFFEHLPVRSGAEMEAALTRAKFQAVARGLVEPTRQVLEAVLADFLPPSYPQEIELQNYVAVLECTSQELLPERYRKLDRQAVYARVQQLKAQLGSV